MIEVLNVIILACQINNGVEIVSYTEKAQAKCQSELIKCVGLSEKPSSKQKELLIKCLVKRGKE
jgi:hypothetical protein